MKIKSILSALLLMVSTVASAQYLNVKLEDGTYRSFKTTPNMKVSFGDKAGAEVMESEQIIKVNGHTVTVKLADDTPANEVMLSLNVEGENVKIEAFSKLNHGLWCSTDDNVVVPVTSYSNGFHTFTLSSLSKDVVVTVRYITVSFDINNSGKNGNFTDKPEDITLGYNTTINEPRRLFSDKYSFNGWYKDKECTEAWNYSTRVTKNLTLYAKWEEDPTENNISGHDCVKLGGYYWGTEYVTGSSSNYTPWATNSHGSYYTKTDNQALNAAESWGRDRNYSWTLPSSAQWQALLDYCDWTWYTNYQGTGMNGYLVTGRVGNYESDHSIFLSCAGKMCSKDDKKITFLNSVGFCWSVNGNGLYFTEGLQKIDHDYCSPDEGVVVRPVAVIAESFF